MSSVKSSFLWNASFQLLRIAIPLVLTPYLTRTLGAESLGVYSYTYSVAYYFSLLCILGLNQYGNREIAKVKADFELRSKVFSSIYAMQLFTVAVVLFLYLIFTVVSDGSLQGLYCIWGLWIVGEAFDLNWLFFGLEEFRLTVIRNFITRITTVILIFMFVNSSNDLWLYCLLQALYFFTSYIVLIPFVLRYVKWIRPTKQDIVSHIKPNLMLFAPIVAISAYTQFGKVLLGNFADMRQVAYFDNSEKIAQIPLAVIQALGTAMLPRMTNLIAVGEVGRGREYLNESFWLATIMACAFSFGIVAVTPEFVAIFFGPGFEPCEGVIRIIAWMIPPVSWSNVMGVQFLLPSGRDSDYTLSVLAGAVVSIIASLFLIGHYGAVGAAIATVLAEVTVTVTQAVLCVKDLPLLQHLMESIPYVIIGMIMFLLVRMSTLLLPLSWAGLTAEVAIGAVVYSCLSATYMFVTHEKRLFRLL